MPIALQIVLSLLCGDTLAEEPSHSSEPTQEAPQEALHIEGIEILGNVKTEEQVIARRILVSAGDLVDEARIEESRLRLLNTGFFKSVEFSLRRGSRRGLVFLRVEVKERNTILIDELYLGFSKVAPFYGGLGVVETNALGRGISTSAGFVAGQNRRAFELRLFLPDLYDTPLKLAASAIALRGAEVIDERTPTEKPLDYRRLGGTLGVGIGVAPSQRIALDYRLESIHADRPSELDPEALRSAPSILFGDSILSTLSLSYERDTRDDPFVPSQGSRISIAVEVGTPLLGSDYEFSKYTAEFQLALVPFQSHRLVIRLNGGIVQGHTPFFNQFFISDFAYFAFGRDSLPRAIQLNFSESNDYDDVVASGGADYNIPIQEGTDALYRTYIYGGIDLSATTSLDERQEDVSGRGAGGHIPLSFDAGVKFDTWIGNFTLSLSYMIDLAI